MVWQVHAERCPRDLREQKSSGDVQCMGASRGISCVQLCAWDPRWFMSINTPAAGHGLANMTPGKQDNLSTHQAGNGRPLKQTQVLDTPWNKRTTRTTVKALMVLCAVSTSWLARSFCERRVSYSFVAGVPYNDSLADSALLHQEHQETPLAFALHCPSPLAPTIPARASRESLVCFQGWV